MDLQSEILGCGRSGTHVTVSFARGPAQGLGMLTTEPYRQRRFLDWLGLHGRVLQCVELALEIRPSARSTMRA